jgi:lysophospholipase L1-like esterase
MLALRDQFADCEQRIELAPEHRPTLAIVGASYTAGVGPGNPMLSWAVDLARRLRWDAVIYGVPGAGYVRTGNDDLGPMARMLTDERLPGLSPALVIVQAGYDDGRVPVGIEGQQVRRTIELIRAEAPHARIGVVTVFTSPARPIPARFYRIDSVIVAAARAADPTAIIMDPLTGQWKYQHEDDGLHPTAAGDAWIARKAEAMLHAHGVDSEPAITAAAAPILCDAGIRTTAPGSGIGI